MKVGETFFIKGMSKYAQRDGQKRDSKKREGTPYKKLWQTESFYWKQSAGNALLCTVNEHCGNVTSDRRKCRRPPVCSAILSSHVTPV